MKKIILLALAAMMMTGCKYFKYEDGSYYTVTTLDSCEYIISGSIINSYNITHKGNCKYCKERRAAEVRRILTEVQDSILLMTD